MLIFLFYNQETPQSCNIYSVSHLGGETTRKLVWDVTGYTQEEITKVEAASSVSFKENLNKTWTEPLKMGCS